MVHGVLLINKTAGGTSHSVVNAVRKIIGQKAVGHAGTLDPIAEGLMVILLGYGTKLSNYLLMNDKSYCFTFRLGITTDTLDKTGKIIDKKEVKLEAKDIQEVLTNSQGKISLPVPLFSAVKMKGKKMYEYTRENKAVTPPLKDMFFYNLVIKNIGSEIMEVELSCSKGSYIRSWVSLVGEKLGTGACLEKLIRLRSAPFELGSALTVQQVEEKLAEEKELNSALLLEKLSTTFIPFSKALPHIKAVCVSGPDEKQLRQGQISHTLKKNLQEKQKEVNQNRETQTVRIMDYNNEQMLALMELRPFMSSKFLRVFPSGLS